MNRKRINLYRYCASEEGTILRRHIPVAVECWYDSRERIWILYVADANGDQVADAEYAADKATATALKQELEQAIQDEDYETA